MATTLNEKTFAQLFTAAGGANGTRVNAQGRIEAAVTPAFDYDPITLAARGLRFRGPSRTNLLINSQLSALGVGEGLTPPTVGTATVDGEACSSVTFTPAMTPGYTGSRWRTSNAAASVATTTAYSQSAYVKLSRPLVANEAITIYYTGASGMGTFAITAASSAPYADRFTRIETPKITPAANGSVYPVVHINTAMGSNLTVWICKGQVEAGANVSNYVPNASTTLNTRIIDQVWIPNLHLQPWYNPQEGTICARVVLSANLVPATATIFGITDAAGATSRTLCYFDSAGGISTNCFDRGVQQAAISAGAGTTAVGQTRKVVLSWKQGRFVVQVDDKPAVVSGLGAIPVYTNPTLWIGARNFGADPLDGLIQDIAYWPKAANAAEMAALTPETEMIAG